MWTKHVGLSSEAITLVCVVGTHPSSNSGYKFKVMKILVIIPNRWIIALRKRTWKISQNKFVWIHWKPTSNNPKLAISEDLDIKKKINQVLLPLLLYFYILKTGLPQSHQKNLHGTTMFLYSSTFLHGIIWANDKPETTQGRCYVLPSIQNKCRGFSSNLN